MKSQSLSVFLHHRYSTTVSCPMTFACLSVHTGPSLSHSQVPDHPNHSDDFLPKSILSGPENTESHSCRISLPGVAPTAVTQASPIAPHHRQTNSLPSCFLAPTSQSPEIRPFLYSLRSRPYSHLILSTDDLRQQYPSSRDNIIEKAPKRPYKTHSFPA